MTANNPDDCLPNANLTGTNSASGHMLLNDFVSPNDIQALKTGLFQDSCVDNQATRTDRDNLQEFALFPSVPAEFILGDKVVTFWVM